MTTEQLKRGQEIHKAIEQFKSSVDTLKTVLVQINSGARHNYIRVQRDSQEPVILYIDNLEMVNIVEGLLKENEECLKRAQKDFHDLGREHLKSCGDVVEPGAFKEAVEKRGCCSMVKHW